MIVGVGFQEVALRSGREDVLHHVLAVMHGEDEDLR
jgi:hypothetical protein